MMASQKAEESPSPSASSIFLPLGRRGSRSSLSTQAERETLTEALDQIHSAAYQSGSLTVFNDFTNPPNSLPIVENNNGSNDSQGGLSGLYSRLRASVGGAKENGLGRRVEGASTAATNKKPKADNNIAGMNEAQASITNSTQVSRIHTPSVGALSPATESFNTVQAFKNNKLTSKPNSISSSKTSLASTPAVKSPVPPVTKTADPAVTEVNVNVAPDGLQTFDSSIGNQSLNAEPTVSERSDNSRSSGNENTNGISSQRSYSPVMSAKPPNTHREGSISADPYLSSKPGNVVTANEKQSSNSAVFDRHDLTELDTSLGLGSRSVKQAESNDDILDIANGNILTASSSSMTADESTAPTSAVNSIRRESEDDGSSLNRRLSAAQPSSVSLEDRDTKPLDPSKLSIERPHEKLVNRVSTSRLPGYVMSRVSSSETATTHSAILSNPGPQPYRHHGSNKKFDAQNNTFTQFRSKLLSREFWMRDENAKDCFLCGEPFTTFRRKHHCRTCGQIFDSKCTSLLPGVYFGQSGSVRVCKPCEDMINSREYDSSDLSDIEQSPVTAKPGNTDFPISSPVANGFMEDEDDTSSIISQSIEHVMKTPTMAIPATRRVNESGNRRSAVLEIESERPLARPTSSRSLRSSASLRSHPMGHKRHHSRQQHLRGFKSYHEDRAPFQQRRHWEDVNQKERLPAFHRDSIIDPDLAQYLSDDASSGDEQPNLLTVVSDSNIAKGSAEHERATFGGLLAAVKKGRSRFSDRSTANGSVFIRDADDASISSSKAVNLPRNSRRRGLSIASSIHQRASPRMTKDNPLLFHDHHTLANSQLVNPISKSGFKMTRSSSMRGSSAPAIELNRLSLEHVRRLLRQLLEDTSIPHANSWETALLPILLKATDDVDPDVQRGDDMDIRHYVKLKKIPGGRPGDTSYVSGLVFTKNLALKSMPRSITRPRILIITFALEYARHQQHFMSLEPVIRQEREFLENLVSRIAALQPNVLLVEKSVSGLALELLEKSNIATAYNVKPSVLEAVSRCTQTRIITSMDKLVTIPAHTGYCDSFDLKTYVHGGRRKTYMYISGCLKELGCTIVLRGANDDVLAKVKRITEFMVYVVYNLKLETCLMRDEFAKLPTVEDFSNGLASTGEKCGVAKVVSTTEFAASHENVSQSNSKDGSSTQATIVTPIVEVPDDVPMPTYYEDMVEKHQTKLLSASPCVKFEPPYLLMRARELERRVSYLARLRDREPAEQNPDEKNKSQKFMLITPEMVHHNPDNAPAKVKEVLRAVHDAELDRAMHNYQTQKRQWEAYISGNSNLFDPYAHQNIVVLYSLVCTTTSIPCSGPDIFALDFYNEHENNDRVFEADCTLGQYVEDLCLEANSVCTANGCEKRMFEHHRQYVHGEAQISIFVQPHSSKLRGLQDTILMWSCCKICGNETQVIPMSANTWRYSFAKYLELSFWSRDLRVRAGVCQHDIHRDYLRFFGFKDMALRIHYDPITLLEIIVPRTRVTWKVDNDLRLRNEVYNKFEHRINKFMLSVKSRLKSIHVESVIPEKVEDCRKEIEILVKKGNDDHNSLIRHLQEKYMGSHYWEVIPLNEVLRAVQEKVVEWDTTFADFEKNFFPSEKDIRRLASLQLKKIFLDKDASATSLTSSDETPTTPTEKEVSGVNGEGERPRSVRRMTLSPEKAKDVLVSVVEEHSGKIEAQDKTDVPELPITDAQVSEAPIVPDPSNVADQEDVEHLDLAIPTSLSEDLQLERQVSTDLAPLSRTITPSMDSERLTPSPELLTRLEPEQKGETDLTDPRTSPKQIPTSSGIPRLVDKSARRSGKARSPPMTRAYSQPLQTLRERSATGSRSGLKLNGGVSNRMTSPLSSPSASDRPKFGDKRFTERIGLGTMRSSKSSNGSSMIPRSIPPKNKSPRVSSLARHFEQLSREFEKERQRERLQRAAKSKHSRAHPIISSKATVEVYKNVREAVEEREPSGEGEEFFSNIQTPVPVEKPDETNEGTTENNSATDKDLVSDNPTSTPHENEQSTAVEHSFETEEAQSDEDQSLTMTDSPEESMKIDDEIDLKELPKHERNTLVKMLANFWAERSASGWLPLDYPLKVSDHVFADCDIIVREDEPSSLIAFALDSSDYKNKLASIQDRYDKEDWSQHDPTSKMQARDQVRVENALLRPTGTHLKYQFQEGQAKMLCKVFYAEQFDALRRKCGVADRIVESLSRCAKWDSKGGKTKSLFLKTLDDRFVLKSLSQIETQAFLKFAPAYFQIMSEALFHELPSAIAKMFGFYQVIIKNPVTGVEFNWFLLLMENLFYDRAPTRIFDLKGSMRNRKVQSTGERDEVLLDENMVDFIYETPLFTREHSKKLLSQSVWNDTLFLGRQNVMDYSLMIAIDEPRQELVVGIIDCIRTYTWDKKLESWIKDRGFAGGGKNRPTVTSPKEYKSRFREAMARYVLQAPNCWHEFHSTSIDNRRIENHLPHMQTALDIDNSDLTVMTNSD